MSSNKVESGIVDFKNALFQRAQSSRLGIFCADSLVAKYIDNIIFIFLIFTILSTAFLGTGKIALFALLTIAAVVFKLLVKKGERIVISKIDMAICIFYVIAIVSLFGSTLFLASLHGFLKLVIYVFFYFCTSHFLRNNKDKIIPLFALVAVLTAFESVVGVVQNFRGVEEISGWQDTSNLDVTEVLSRCYGTLKPYNPNLLAGYLLAGMSSIFYFFALNFIEGKKKRGLIFLFILLISFLSLIYSGSRGGYLGLLAFIAMAVWGIYYHIKTTIGFENLRKRYKNLAAVVGAGLLAFVLTTPAILKRVMSIFALRTDSSVSFRLNVYEASIRMFLDNFFLGIGLGNQNFREIYGLYMKTTFDALGAYSVPLETAVETGIFGLLAFLYFIFLSFKYCLNLVKSNISQRNRLLAMTILLTLTATMVHGLWDTVWYRPQVQIIFWLNIACLNSLLLREDAPKV